MSIMDELKKLTQPYSDDDETMMDDDLDMDVEEPSYTRPAAAPVQPVAEPVAAPVVNPAPVSNMGAGFSITDLPGSNMGTMASGVDASRYRVVLVQPEKFDAATAIAEHICQGDTVILNCENTDEQVARRVIDFLSGCAFALNGSIKRASTKVIIIAPKDVGVDDAKNGEQLGE